jgi:hypothetical protein
MVSLGLLLQQAALKRLIPLVGKPSKFTPLLLVELLPSAMQVLPVLTARTTL